jgi:hypothetical protein
MKICDCPLGWGALAGTFLCGCAGAFVPPVSLTAGFFGATVTVSEPGFTVPAKVVPTAAVVTPTLLVPSTDPVTTGTIPITTTAGTAVNVPVTVAPVTQAVLAVPK